MTTIENRLRSQWYTLTVLIIQNVFHSFIFIPNIYRKTSDFIHQKNQTLDAKLWKSHHFRVKSRPYKWLAFPLKILQKEKEMNSAQLGHGLMSTVQNSTKCVVALKWKRLANVVLEHRFDHTRFRHSIGNASQFVKHFRQALWTMNFI